MNAGIIKDLFDKFEDMENIPASIMNELARAIEARKKAEQQYANFQYRSRQMQIAFEKLMELHQELREKSGFDNNTDELTYDLFEQCGLFNDGLV